MDNKYIPAFLWIKSYRSIRNKGFHFTDEYTYTYDQDKNTLTRKKNNDYVRDFYGDSISISAIVGENGAGETTILSAIMDFFYDSCDAKMILAFSNGEVWIKSKEKVSSQNKTYYQKKIYSFSFDDKKDAIILIKTEAKESYILSEKNSPISCVYYSQALDSFQFGNNNTSIINLSSASLMNCGMNPDYNDSMHSINNYYADEYFKQIRFVEDMRDENEELIGFKLPKQVTVSLKYINHSIIVEYLTRYILSNRITKQEQDELKHFLRLKPFCRNKGLTYATIYQRFFFKRDQEFIKSYFNFIVNEFVNTYLEGKVPFINKLKCYLAANFFSSLCGRFGGRYASGISYFYLIKYLNLTMKRSRFYYVDNWERIKILFNVITSQFYEITDKGIKREIIELGKLYDYFNNELFVKCNSLYKDDGDSISFNISIKNNEFNDRALFDITFKEFWGEYKNVSKYCAFFEFSWNLSSGEICRLELYSRLYDITVSKRWTTGEFNGLYVTKNSMLLLIDEADMLLHPEWQRSLINDIVTVFPKIFPGQYISVIVATHSPIMLSDIPKQNVLFLKKEDEIKAVDGCDTFASNIFQLFREGFFIGDTGIGVFAEKKLKDIVGYIHGKKDDSGKKPNDEEIKKMISAVGDTFLRNKLKEEYLLYWSKAKTVEEKQAEKITALESEKGELLEKQRILKEQKAENVLQLKKALEKAESYEAHLSEEGTESEVISEVSHDLNEPSKENSELLETVRKILEEMEKQEL